MAYRSPPFGKRRRHGDPKVSLSVDDADTVDKALNCAPHEVGKVEEFANEFAYNLEQLRLCEAKRVHTECMPLLLERLVSISKTDAEAYKTFMDKTNEHRAAYEQLYIKYSN